MAISDAIIGAEFVGVLVATALWGVTCMQTWWCFETYPNDPKYLKILVIATWISDTIHEFLICHIAYTSMVSNFGDPSSLLIISPLIFFEVVFNAITGLIVQSFFTHRIWSLRRNYWLVTVLVLLVLGEFGISLAFMGVAIDHKLYSALGLESIRPLSMGVNILAALTDLVITASMCTVLSLSRTGFARSNNIINRLILFSVNTGLITTICACISLITILTLPDTFVYVTFYFIMYANSLLATLNARKSIRGIGRPTDSAPSGIGSNNTRNMFPLRPPMSGFQIEIDTAVREEGDSVGADVERKP
ncbi:hypothetical protein PM082_018195 [Marasmius tenuissimus]|nr:hypothetical protein PM082_018195 [Marasmius tenuissimus]